MSWSGRLLALLLAVVWLPVAATAAPAVKVAVVSSDASVTQRDDLKARLEATGRLGSVATVLATTSTPSLGTLQQYDALVVYTNTNSPPADRVALGDVLADYIDGGGGVVMMAFGEDPTTWGVTGRFASGGYRALVTSSAASTSTGAMTVAAPTHPVFYGAAAATCAASCLRYGTATLASGATSLATWSTGGQAIAVKGRVVSFNVFGPSTISYASSWDASSGMATLLANAAIFTSVAASDPAALVLAAAPSSIAEPAQRALWYSGRFSKVDIVYSDSVTPTVAALNAYDVAFVLGGNGALHNATVLGDNLATFVDGGGGVVLTPFANGYSPWRVEGRFTSGGYHPTTAGVYGNGALGSLSWSQAFHPIKEGVTSAPCASCLHIAATALEPGAQSLATWSTGGLPAVAYKNTGGGRVVSINAYTGSVLVTGPTATHFDVLFANAAAFVTRRSKAMLCYGTYEAATRDIYTKVVSPGGFGELDPFDCGTATPTATQLGRYEAVLVVTDRSLLTPVAIGDALATYAEGGKGVVVGQLALSDYFAHLAGRIRTAPYVPITSTGDYGGAATLTKDVASHAIFAGVTSLTANLHFATASLTSGSQLLGHFGTNTPAVAAKLVSGGGAVVGLNFWLPSTAASAQGYTATTDGARLIANAVDWSIDPCVDADGDGHGAASCGGTDCNDDDNTIYPGAPELCDGLKNNCNSATLPANETDQDGDRYVGCTVSVWRGGGTVVGGGDCEDRPGAPNWGQYKTPSAGATHYCDGIANACGGALDPGESDADADKYTVCTWNGPSGWLGDPAKLGGGDCNDVPGNNGAYHYPAGTERCDGVANVCGSTVAFTEIDNDGDHYVECTRVTPWLGDSTVIGGGDCDDTGVHAAFLYPGAQFCDGISNDCAAPGVQANEIDDDGDGYVECTYTVWRGATAPTGGGDCKDSDRTVHPGAVERCDGQANTCTGPVPSNETDDDPGGGDGYVECTVDPGGWDGLPVKQGEDCDDGNRFVYPTAPELVDGIDNNCNGVNEVTDTDSDGLTDELELSVYGSNRNLPDSDGDRLTDGEEVHATATSPTDPDTDDDLIRDDDEDPDFDDLSNYDELRVHFTLPRDADTDDDAADDGVEVFVLGTDPLDPDTDDDDVDDGLDNCPLLANGDQADLDEDGEGDVCDFDADNDGLTDDEEDDHGTNPGLWDTDGDGVGDGDEVGHGLNPLLQDSDSDGTLDPDEDLDGDGLTVEDELYAYGTDPSRIDTDGDGLHDDQELFDTLTDPSHPDTDRDGVSDGDEDRDGDGVTDGDEFNALFTDWTLEDTDGDGTFDGDEDFDADRLTNAEELYLFGTDPYAADTDGDGLDDRDEIEATLTDPNDADSDDDGTRDGAEDPDLDTLTSERELYVLLTDPRDPDTDDDLLDDGDEVALGTDPLDPDTDNDTVLDGSDNCPRHANPGQEDANTNGVGDVCDHDLDNDGVSDDEDNCPAVANADQADGDDDDLGDACDPDLDNDGFPNASDNCPDVANAAQDDLDDDGTGDACDDDADGDDVADTVDNCPDVANADQADGDDDGTGDACDDDGPGDDTGEPSGGCGCATGPSPVGGWLGLLTLAAAARRRRRAA